MEDTNITNKTMIGCFHHTKAMEGVIVHGHASLMYDNNGANNYLTEFSPNSKITSQYNIETIC